jgi:hypothetical protein
MINNKDNVSTWISVDPYESSPQNNSENFNRDVSNWLPPHEEPINKPQNSLNRNQNSDVFVDSIIRVFAGEPQRYAPEIKDQKRNQSLVDFIFGGLNAQGPATNSNPVPHRPYQSSQNQQSLLDFLGNPSRKPKTSIFPESSSTIGVKANYLYV